MIKWCFVVVWYFTCLKVWPMDWSTSITAVKSLVNVIPWIAGLFVILEGSDKLKEIVKSVK